MGNIISSYKEDEQIPRVEITNETLIEYIDNIATNYILKQSMMDMVRFTDKEYYDNMLILTSYIMKSQLGSLDLSLLKERVLNGNKGTQELNANTNNKEITNNSELNDNKESKNNTESNIVYYTSESKLKDITLDNEKQKQKVLLLISKFYIKIMTIFSAITSIIDPQYVYEDDNGNKQYFFLKNFDSYPANLDLNSKKLRISQLDNPINFVNKRLNILKNKLNEKNDNEKNIVINPGEKICDKNDNNNNITDEIGIKELDSLYFDVYDYDENKWNKKSENMQKKYDEDVLLFYQIFTGKKEKPYHIKSFSDIESLDFHNLKRCINRDFYQDLLVSRNDVLFQKYMEKIDQIQSITKSHKIKLMYILKQIFIKNEKDDNVNFSIHPKLNYDNLLEYQNETKKIINQIYINCERLFIEALLLYEKMYENQHGELTENQMKNLNENKREEIEYTPNENDNANEDQNNETNIPPTVLPLSESETVNATPQVIVPQTPEAQQTPQVIVPQTPNTQQTPQVIVPQTPNAQQTPQVIVPQNPDVQQTPQIIVPQTPDVQQTPQLVSEQQSESPQQAVTSEQSETQQPVTSEQLNPTQIPEVSEEKQEEKSSNNKSISSFLGSFNILGNNSKNKDVPSLKSEFTNPQTNKNSEVSSMQNLQEKTINNNKILQQEEVKDIKNSDNSKIPMMKEEFKNNTPYTPYVETPTETPVSEETPSSEVISTSIETPTPAETPTSAETPTPTETPMPAETSTPVETPMPSETPTPNPLQENIEVTPANENPQQYVGGTTDKMEEFAEKIKEGLKNLLLGGK